MAEAKGAEAGFTLIETLVAFVILSGAIILSLSAMTQSLQRMRHSAEIVGAAELAQTIFKSVSMQKSKGAKITSGSEGELTWQIEIFPLGPSSQQVTRPSLIRIKISDRRGVNLPQAGFESILIMQNGQ